MHRRRDVTIEPDLTDLVDLLSEVTAQLRSFETEAGADEAAIAGASPGAEENRTIAAARAALARNESSTTLESLGELREQARQLAVVARRVRATAVATRSSGAPDAAGAGARTGDERPDDRATHLTAAARRLVDADDRAAMLDVLLRGALAVLPGEGRAGVVVRGPEGAVTCEASTDVVVDELLAAHRADGGPVSAVLAGAAPVCVPDVGAERRWPELMAAAAARDVGSLLVRGLPARRLEPGPVLVVCAADPLPADAPAWRAVETLADHVTIALAGAVRADGLQHALRHRDVIGQAKGILLHRDGLAPDEAFARLVAASQHSNVKLHDVARWFVEETRAAAPSGRP